MAPMALMILRAAGGGDYSQAIERSQRWILKNELGVSLIDEEATAIWRNIERTEPAIASLGNNCSRWPDVTAGAKPLQRHYASTTRYGPMNGDGASMPPASTRAGTGGGT
ncbi:hypothetical protein AJ87_47620 [Rhizobium yanglingense]|nr:hypothetical protein AJ87_47620 [Rhizobium yanglingense]